MLSRSKFHVPATIAAYNTFMNAVDHMDQLRSTNITQHQEKRLHMTMWMVVLDLAVHNAYCVYMASTSSHREHKSLSFKQAVSEQLVQD